MTTRPGDDLTAASRGRMRSSHADREQAIEVLKDAFAQGRLDKDEFDARVGHALASRTYAQLAAVTADIPAAPAVAEPVAAAPVATERTSTPARTLRKAALRAALCVLIAAALVGIAFLTQNPISLFFAVLAVPGAAIAVSGFLGYGVIDAWQERRSRAQLRSGPGGGNAQIGHGQSPRRTGSDSTLPDRARPDRTRADLRIRKPQPRRAHPSRKDARTLRGIRPVPDAV